MIQTAMIPTEMNINLNKYDARKALDVGIQLFGLHATPSGLTINRDDHKKQPMISFPKEWCDKMERQHLIIQQQNNAQLTKLNYVIEIYLQATSIPITNKSSCVEAPRLAEVHRRNLNNFIKSQLNLNQSCFGWQRHGTTDEVLSIDQSKDKSKKGLLVISFYEALPWLSHKLVFC